MNMNVKKRQGSPDFVLGSFGCPFGDLEAFVNAKGYVNFDLMKGREEGSMYVKVSEYGLDKEQVGEEKKITKISEMTQEEIPF